MRRRPELLRLLIPSALALLFFFLGGVAADYPVRFGRPNAITAIGLWVVGCGCIGIFLYMMRQEARLLYGCIEVIFASGALAAAVINAIQVLESAGRADMPAGQAKFVAIFIIAAAIYILVRGLDNIGEGLRKHPGPNKRWERIFPKEK
jgi:hypothetical protein